MNLPTADLTAQITSRTEIGGAIAVLTLTNADPATTLPRWRPGDHVDLLLGDGLVRQYSLCGDPTCDDTRTWRLAVLRETAGRGGSAKVFDELRPGDTVALAGPRNTFEYAPGPPALFIAGGIGVTAIAPMAAAAAAAGIDYSLHYAGRDGRLAFLDELTERHGRRLLVHRSGHDRLDLAAVLRAAAPGTAVYCCGPLSMIDEAQRIALDLGLAFHAERFEAEPLTAAVWEGDFEVELAASGVTVTVPPDRSILQVAEDNGVFVLSSCQEGTCGTCETTVLDGTVDHRDSILTPAERQDGSTMYICVSRAACPRLVLDL